MKTHDRNEKTHSVKSLEKAVISTHRENVTKNKVTERNVEVMRNAFLRMGAFLTPEKCQQFANKGLSKQTIAGLFEVSITSIDNDPALLAAFNLGRASTAALNRQAIITEALEKENLTAMIYLDKLMGGDVEVKNVSLSISNGPLKDVSDDKLLEIDVDTDE